MIIFLLAVLRLIIHLLMAHASFFCYKEMQHHALRLSFPFALLFSNRDHLKCVYFSMHFKILYVS